MTISDFDEITTDKPEKSLLAPVKRHGGRNNTGRITTRHQGGGHKRRYRIIDFKRRKDGVPATVASIEYDPNRSARIALLHYVDGHKAYILAPQRLGVGATVQSGADADIKVGQLPAAVGRSRPARSCTPSSCGPARARAWCARPARAPSWSPRRTGTRCCACPPASSAASPRRAARRSAASATRRTRTSPSGKAGRSRWLGKRPSVRGTAMNPVDHPHGGGEGKNKGSHPVTPWGKITLGRRTRDPKKASSADIVRGRKRGKGRS